MGPVLWIILIGVTVATIFPTPGPFVAGAIGDLTNGTANSSVVNQCETFKPCDDNAACTDSASGFSCDCNSGFTGNGTTCADVDECGGSTACDSNAVCTNLAGTFSCDCRTGYTGDGNTCADINECLGGTSCDGNATCTNTKGAFRCACNDGYEGDGRSCTDINECTRGVPCDSNADCTNSDGSFTCQCKHGFVGDGLACEATLIHPSLVTLYRENIVFTVIEVPTSQNIKEKVWNDEVELKLASLFKKSFLAYILATPNSNPAAGRRRKRLAASGDYQVQLVHSARVNPSIRELVTLSYIVANDYAILPAIQVERAVSSLSIQDVTLELGYPVDVVAEALEGSERYISTEPPPLSDLELSLIIAVSVVGGLVLLGVLIWCLCCCITLQNRNRAEFKRIDVEMAGQPQLVSATPLAKPPVRESPADSSVIKETESGVSRALPTPSTNAANKYIPKIPPRKTESPDDGFSENDSKMKRSSASSSSTPPVSQHSSRSHTRRSMRPGNRIAPSVATSDSFGDTAIYASINKLPPLDTTRRYLVANETDRAELEYYRNKQHNRSLRSLSRQRGGAGTPRSSKSSKHHRHRGDDSDTGMETDDILNNMDQNRTRMHRLLDDVLAIASPAPSKTPKDSGSVASSKKEKKKKKRSKSSDSSSSSSSSDSSSKESDKSSKKSDKEKSSSSKKSNSKKDKKSKDKKEGKDKKMTTPHEPLNLNSTGDPYSQFSVSPYAASDGVAQLEQSGVTTHSQTTAWVMDSPLPSAGTLKASPRSVTPQPTKHDWSTRKTIHIPKPKLGTPELDQLANIKSAANDDNYTSLVLSTAMFRSRSPNWEDVPS